MLIPQAIVQQVASGGLTVLYDSTLGADAASFDATSLPQTGKHMLAVYRIRGAAATTSLNTFVQLNGDTGANYQRVNSAGGGAAGQTSGYTGDVAANTAPAGDVGAGMFFLPDYTSATWFKVFFALQAFWAEGTTSGYGVNANMWDGTGAVTRVTVFLASASDMQAGSRLTIYAL